MNKQDKKEPDAKAWDDIRQQQDQECMKLLQDMEQLRWEMENIDTMLVALRGDSNEADRL